jgi:hypothetical protein
MKVMKILTTVIAATAAFAFCASSARAVSLTTTNDIILSLTLTISTNSETFVSDTNYSFKVGSVKLANKNLLQLLGGGNGFADEVFSNTDQIAIAYDAPWGGDVVIVDKTGSNVLYDVTKNGGNTNATLAINLLKNDGTYNEKVDYKPSGSLGFTTYYGGTFTLLDNTNDINITGSGPASVTYTQALTSSKEFSTNELASWTDSATFNFFGASNEHALDKDFVTISGTVTGKGSGKGGNDYLNGFFF